MDVELQPYRELSWVRNALVYANSDKCDKKAKKIIYMLIQQAESFRISAYKSRKIVNAVRKTVKKQWD